MSPARPLSSLFGTTERAHVGTPTSRGSLHGGTMRPSALLTPAVATNAAMIAPATGARGITREASVAGFAA